MSVTLLDLPRIMLSDLVKSYITPAFSKKTKESPQIIFRSAARNAGLPRYFTGIPCKYGHTCERYTASGVCVQCHRNYVSVHYFKKKKEAERVKAMSLSEDILKEINSLNRRILELEKQLESRRKNEA